jgi:hypothetical protein
MTGFETYDLGAWMSDGLTVHPLVTVRPSANSRRPSVITRIFLPAVAVGALALYAAKPVAQWLFDEPARFEQAAMQSDIVPSSPILYWSNAVAALKNAPRVEESGPADPPTRY